MGNLTIDEVIQINRKREAKLKLVLGSILNSICIKIDILHNVFALLHPVLQTADAKFFN